MASLIAVFDITCAVTRLTESLRVAMLCEEPQVTLDDIGYNSSADAPTHNGKLSDYKNARNCATKVTHGADCITKIAAYA